MLASAQIVGRVRLTPDDTSSTLPAYDPSLQSNFRNVLDQFHTSREDASKKANTSDPAWPKQKDADPSITSVVAQPVTPPVEAPQFILPFTTSITLRCDATASVDDAAQTSAASVDLRNEHPEIATARRLQADSITPAPDQTAAAHLVNIATGDTFTPVLPVISSTTSEPFIADVQDPKIGYQSRSSTGRPTEKVFSHRAGEEPQSAADPTQTVFASIPVTNVVPQPPISVTAEKTLAQDSSESQNSPTGTGIDLKNSALPAIESAGPPTVPANAGEIVFAARLTSTVELQPPGSESGSPVGPLPSSIAPLQLTPFPVTVKQIALGADLPSDAHSGDSGGRPEKDKSTNWGAKPETFLPQIHAAVADQPVIPANSHASASPLPSAARLNQVDAPAVPANSNHDITVRIPDATGQGTAVRFVERAGEIHVSVRSSDAEMAQTLRGELSDLVNHLEDGGMRTEVWQPGTGTNAAFSQNDSQHPFADSDGSNGRQPSSGSNSEQESKGQNRPRWVEELEGSIGNTKSKETTQLWQA